MVCCLLSMTGSGFTSVPPTQKAVVVVPASKVGHDVLQPPVPKNEIPITPVKEKEKVTETITISFIGDCLIATASGGKQAGSLNWTASHRPASYFFEKVDDILKSDDFTVANCENVFTDSAFTPIKKSGRAFWFRSAAKNAFIFQSGGVDIVSIANNHTGDYGKAGFLDTIKALENAGLQVGYNNLPVLVEKNNIRIGIICCDLWGYSHYKRTIKQLKDIQPDTDIQIVYFHGGQENIHRPEEWKKSAARKIAEAGADLVVGGHPHVLQPMEVYQGVPIVYSIGNFVYGGNRQPENRTIIFQSSFEIIDGKTSVSYSIIPCYVYTKIANNWQPDRIKDQDEKNRVLDFMHGNRKLPY